jgi:predicted regulator of amino acid metabolism with ACT domain
MTQSRRRCIRRPSKSVLSVLAAYNSWTPEDGQDRYEFVATKVGVSREFVKSCLGLLQYMPTSKNVLEAFQPTEVFIDECQTIDFSMIEKAVSRINNTYSQCKVFHTEF